MTPHRIGHLRAYGWTVVLAMFAGAGGGCCVPEGDPEWMVRYSGRSYNIHGDGETYPNPLEGCAVRRNLFTGEDAIIIGEGHNWSEIVVFCRLPADPNGAYVGDTAGIDTEAAPEVWLVRGPLMPNSFAARDARTSFLDLSPDERRACPDAYPMHGRVRLRLNADRVRSLTVDLATDDPVPYAPDGTETNRIGTVYRSPRVPRDVATLSGTFTGGAGRFCRPVPFI